MPIASFSFGAEDNPGSWVHAPPVFQESIFISPCAEEGCRFGRVLHNELSRSPWTFDGTFEARHSGSAFAEELDTNSYVKEVFCLDTFLLKRRKAGEK